MIQNNFITNSLKFGQGEFFKTFVVYVYRGFACVCRGRKRALRSPGPGVTDSCELEVKLRSSGRAVSALNW